jgi:hypothetical protein
MVLVLSLSDLPKRHYYPDAGTRYKKAENLLNREFEQQTLNTHWVGDIT